MFKGPADDKKPTEETEKEQPERQEENQERGAPIGFRGVRYPGDLDKVSSSEC